MGQTSISRIIPLGISLQRIVDAEKDKLLDIDRKRNPVLAKEVDLNEGRRKGLNEALSIVSQSYEGFSSREEYERAKPIIENIYKKIMSRIIPSVGNENNTNGKSKKGSE